MLVAKSLALFAVAGLCEIGGGYLVWQWWRNGAPLAVGTPDRFDVLGVLICLAGVGVIMYAPR